jgi:hypothetical protein
MCSLTLALTGLTTGLSMASQYQQSRAQAAAYEAQAQAAYDNAKIQNKKSEIQAEQYAQQQRDLDNRRRLIVGQQTAQAGASGLAGNVGSPLDIYNASMSAWSEDTNNLLNNQRNDQWSNYTQEVNYRNQGNAAMANASAAKQAGNMAIAGGVISLLGSAYSSNLFGKGGSGTSSAATAQTPTAAGYQATGLDRAMSGISGYTPVSTGSVKGFTQTFGPAVKAYNPYTMAQNGVYWKR